MEPYWPTANPAKNVLLAMNCWCSALSEEESQLGEEAASDNLVILAKIVVVMFACCSSVLCLIRYQYGLL